jgi:hypothetical protein
VKILDLQKGRVFLVEVEQHSEEKQIKHPQYSSELYVSKACLGFLNRVPSKPYTHLQR